MIHIVVVVVDDDDDGCDDLAVAVGGEHLTIHCPRFFSMVSDAGLLPGGENQCTWILIRRPELRLVLRVSPSAARSGSVDEHEVARLAPSVVSALDSDDSSCPPRLQDLDWMTGSGTSSLS